MAKRMYKHNFRNGEGYYIINPFCQFSDPNKAYKVLGWDDNQLVEMEADCGSFWLRAEKADVMFKTKPIVKPANP